MISWQIIFMEFNTIVHGINSMGSPSLSPFTDDLRQVDRRCAKDDFI